MGKWVSKHGRSPSRKSSQKSHRTYSLGQEECDPRPSKGALSHVRGLGPNSAPFQNPDSVTCLDSCNKRYCLSGSSDGVILLQDLDREEIISQVLGHSKEVTKVRFATSNVAYFLSASRDKTIKIWQTESQSSKGQLHGHTLSVTAIDCDSQMKKIWSGSRDNTVCLWDVETEDCIQECKISRNLVTDLCFAAEFNLIVQTAEDRIVKLWDSRSLEVIHSFPIQNQIQMSCSVSGNTCVTTNNGFGKQGCEMCIWDLRERRLLQTLGGHSESTTACKFVGNDVVSCSHDGTIKLWQTKQNSTDKSLSSTLHLSSGNLTCLSVLSNQKVVAGSFEKGILIANIKDTKLTF